MQLVLWPEDSAAPREWVLSNIAGASGIIVVLSDLVNEELLNAGLWIPPLCFEDISIN
jgi:hypothetical protein